ncbi:MAG TPA: FKBP-type peptidyl-prolyl cis-trans isomerase [Pirellulales bacterium]|nr:FKBP-type peptidyl-prolyl cis-trans isomerase [Pirellulales bacterium]
MRRTLGIGVGLLAVAAFTMAHAQQPAAQNGPPAREALPAGGAAAPTASPFKSLKDRSSYAIGVDVGRDFKQQGLDVDTTIVAQGIADSLAGKTLMTDQEMHATMVELQRAIQSRQQELAEKSKKAGETFLAENKKREGVKTLPSGLQYKVLKQGTGATPKANDTVTTNYRGTLLDGTEFDNSAKHGGPATFSVNGVIPGWTEALQLMREGDKWQLFIPSDLAYGAHGAPPDIGPNSTLVFDIELLKVQPGQAAPAPNAVPQ